MELHRGRSNHMRCAHVPSDYLDPSRKNGRRWLRFFLRQARCSVVVTAAMRLTRSWVGCHDHPEKHADKSFLNLRVRPFPAWQKYGFRDCERRREKAAP